MCGPAHRPIPPGRLDLDEILKSEVKHFVFTGLMGGADVKARILRFRQVLTRPRQSRSGLTLPWLSWPRFSSSCVGSGRVGSSRVSRPRLIRVGLISLGVVLALVPLQGQRWSLAQRPVLFTDPFLIGSLASNGADPKGLTNEGQRPDPLDFSEAELRDLNRRFGVHGPQPKLAQLFTEGLDQLQPLRVHTLSRVEALRPLILAESRRHHINPMLVAAVLFDELQHAKPGEDAPLVAESGLFQTHGPAQLSLGEMQKQGLLSEHATPEQISEARLHLLDPEGNVQVLVGKFARLSKALSLPQRHLLMASNSPRDAKALATLAYLHNGKLDYPGRILRYMQDAELHGLIYGSRTSPTSVLI